MENVSANDLALLALFGAFINNFLTFIKLRHIPKSQRRDFKDVLYWAWFFGTPVVAYFVVFEFSSPTFANSKMNAFIIGLGIEALLEHGGTGLLQASESSAD
jgi:hypothetical protein